MKHQTKIVLLVALALFLTLTACTRQASQAPVTQPTPTSDVAFPVSTPGVGQFGTQTQEALTPVAQATDAPQVNLATPTQAGTGGNDNQSGGGQAAPATQAPVATATQAVQVPAITVPNKYTLQKGEWPICIARRFDLDISTFFAQNGLSMASKPAAGVVLNIPANSKWNSVYGSRSLQAHPASYTVKSGDSVYSIACVYGDVSPEQILAANGGIKAEDIKSGMKLSIP